MNTLPRAWRAVTLASALTVPFAGLGGTPYPTARTPQAVDAGALSVTQGAITVTVALKLRDAQGANALLQSMYTPGNTNFGRFLTPDEFRDRFAPTDAQFSKVRASLVAFGLAVDRATSTTMRVTGTPAAIEQAFKVSLRKKQVAGEGSAAPYVFREPSSAPSIPVDADSLVHAVFGLSTRPLYRPNLRHASTKVGSLSHNAAPAADGGNTPGFWTVTDFARHYNVTPLYDQGVRGAGRTIGIVTLASFTPSDAFAYWRAQGLTVDPNRITVVNVDGGPGAPSDDSGSDETTLDVEQSGGLASAAKIVVYQAPNTDQGFLDAFARAVDANQADAVSTSWGLWEFFSNRENGPVSDVYTGRTVSGLRAFHEVFLQAALQGQSLFAASGDSGAYDAAGPLPPPNFSLALSVDHPASDTLMTAAGGTTLPGKQTYVIGGGQPNIVVDIKKERVWSWDYLVPLCDALGFDPISCGIFPVGGGGGVSVFFDRPFYQDGLDGIQKSEPRQTLVEFDVVPAQTIYKLPGRFAGRNVPDISANADPETGYTIYYTSDQSGFGIDTFGGGTSFVAPQLAGVTVLLSQSLRHRVGLLNVPMYAVARSNAYGPNGALQPIKTGNNDFYEGSNGYNPGAGLGILDVAKFATTLRRWYN